MLFTEANQQTAAGDACYFLLVLLLWLLPLLGLSHLLHRSLPASESAARVAVAKGGDPNTSKRHKCARLH